MARRAAESPLENVRERGRGERADRDRGHRHADLDSGDVFVDAVELAQRKRRAARAFLAHDLQARALGAHERILGGDEERVDRDQDDREYELEPVHAGSAPVRADLLRGGFSSSFIDGRPAQP